MFLEPIRVLSMAEMERIHEGALHVLERVGMRFESTRALAYLRKAGCSVDEQSCVVKFPKRIVQDAVDRMRRAYDNPDRLPARMSVRYAHIRFRKEPHRIHPDFTTSAGGFCVYIWDFQGRRRPATMDDVHRSIHLVNRLTDIDYTGLPVSDQEVPFRLRPVRMAAELAKYTTKFGGVETFRRRTSLTSSRSVPSSRAAWKRSRGNRSWWATRKQSPLSASIPTWRTFSWST